MRKLSNFTTLMAIMLIAACGGGDGFVDTSGGGNTGTNPDAPVAAAVTVVTSSPSLPSDAGQKVTISAIVRDANNVAVKGVSVILSSDSGILTVASPVTDDSGVVTATLTAGSDPSNRTIMVTAEASGVTDTVAVDVQGTRLSVAGPTALALGDNGVFSIVLVDAGGNGISGVDVNLSSSAGNTLSSPTVTTSTTGQATAQLTATTGGNDTVTATALSETAVSANLSVSDDNFVITQPVSTSGQPPFEIALGVNSPITLHWDIAGVNQGNRTVTFSSTRGTLDTATSITDVITGNATNGIVSSSAGFATITASVLDPTTNLPTVSTSAVVEFVANTPTSIDVQASPLTVGTGEVSAIVATVRDVNSNLVKGQLVSFSVLDVTGGQLSTSTSVTNSQGQAFTSYTASSTTSAKDGVAVTASLQALNISNTVNLTVGQRELFISIGTGNTIFEPNSADYRKEFSVRITDAVGNGVAGVTVQVGVLSDNYYEGFWKYNTSILVDKWERTQTAGPCKDEDINRNGFLDPGEDINGSGSIEAGNVANVVPQNGSGGSFVTDAAGSGLVDLIYSQEFARWVDVTISATTGVQGTEFEQTTSFQLPISASDVEDEFTQPPGIISPYGQQATCEAPDP
jgi:hypothetical protein